MNKALCVILALCLGMGGLMVAPAVDSETAPISTHALVPHAPIRIDSNADFPGIATAGNGTVWAPWVIENWEINGTGFGYCIFIGNTTDHFTVRNCSMHNASGVNNQPYYPDSGVVLYNVSVGMLLNNTAFYNWMGLRCEDAHNISIFNNTAYLNDLAGLYLTGSSDMAIEGNFAWENEYSIWVSTSTNNTLKDNVVSNSTHGINIGGGFNNVLETNNATNNTYGITLYWSTCDTLIGNTMYGNGVAVSGTVKEQWNTHNIGISNKVNNKPVHYWKNQTAGTVPSGAGQVILANCSNVIVTGQNASGGSVGILLGYSQQNIIIDNTANFNKVDGIVLYGSSNNEIVNNTAQSNTENGIILSAWSANNIVEGNNASLGNRYGIYLSSSQMNSIEGNNASSNSYGMFIYFSSYNTIINNTVSQNNWTGMYFQGSHENEIYHNNIVNNAPQAYDNTGTNLWNATYPIGGNHWNDYLGVDDNSGLAQAIPGSDGMGDTPYANITGGAGAQDNYPLMAPFGSQHLGETIPPIVQNYSPQGANVTSDALIMIEWNETMNWTSVEVAFSYTDGVVNMTSANGSWAHDPLTNISVFNPFADFEYEMQYIVTVNRSAADVVGNTMDQDLVWNFTTTDRAPYVESTKPADGQIDVDPNKNIEIHFSEKMNWTSVEEGFSYTNGTETWDFADGLTDWFETPDAKFIYSPAEPLPLNQTFTATLNGTVVQDTGGKLLEGGDYIWTFTTWLEPPAPHVIDTYPPSGASNVNVNTYINVIFDTEMSPTSLNGAFSYTDGTDVWDMTNGTVDWFSENTVFSFEPTEKLRFDSTYTVRITSNATSVYDKKLDGNDNNIEDVSDDFVFTFSTTPEPPTILSYYPDEEHLVVPVSLSAIFINFTHLMDITSVTNALSVSPSVPFTPAFTGSGANLTMVLGGELSEGTTYRVTVLGTATDMDGVRLDGNADGVAGDKFTFSFATPGIEIPDELRVVAIFPTYNATEVPLETFIAMTFNAPMNRTSVQEAFSFRNATTELNGTFVWRTDSKNFNFILAEPLSYNMTYYVTLQGTAKDQDGRMLGNVTEWQFVTVAEEVPTSYKDWIIYGAIVFLVIMVIMLFMANRSLRRDLKRTRVKLKKLKREHGIKDEPETVPKEPGEPAPEEIKPPEKPADAEKSE